MNRKRFARLPLLRVPAAEVTARVRDATPSRMPRANTSIAHCRRSPSTHCGYSGSAARVPPVASPVPRSTRSAPSTKRENGGIR